MVKLTAGVHTFVIGQRPIGLLVNQLKKLDNFFDSKFNRIGGIPHVMDDHV